MIIGFVGVFIGIAGVLGALLSALLGVFTLIDTYFDMLAYVSCPGFDILFPFTVLLNVLSILIGLAGLFFGLPGFVVFFAIGVLLFIIGFMVGGISTLYFQATCKK